MPGNAYGFPNSFTHFKNIYFVPRSYRECEGRYKVTMNNYYNRPRQHIYFSVLAYGKLIIVTYAMMIYKHITQLLQLPELPETVLQCTREGV